MIRPPDPAPSPLTGPHSATLGPALGEALGPALSVGAAVDRLGTGPFQRRLLLICGLTWAADAMEVLLGGFALPGVSASFGLARGSGAATLFLSVLFLGMLAGAWFWGALADRLGRRRVFLITVSLGVVFGLASALAPSFAALLVFRLLTGFAIGGTLPVDYSLMAELVPTERRGRYLVLLESFWAPGTVLVAALAWGLSAAVPLTEGWRWLMGASAVLGVVGLLARVTLPDSPRWLLARGRMQEATAALARVARLNRRPLDFTLSPEPVQPGGLGALFRPPLRRRTLLLSLVWFGLSLGYYGLFSWLPSYLRLQGMELGLVYRNTLLLALAQIPGYALAGYLVDRAGRRATLVGFLLLSAVGCFLFLLAGNASAVLLANAALSFALLGAWGALYSFTPELFPTPVRGGGVGFVSGMARLASVFAPTLGALLVSGALPAALGIYAALFIAAALAALLIGSETRGQPLPEGVGAPEAAGLEGAR